MGAWARKFVENAVLVKHHKSRCGQRPPARGLCQNERVCGGFFFVFRGFFPGILRFFGVQGSRFRKPKANWKKKIRAAPKSHDGVSAVRPFSARRTLGSDSTALFGDYGLRFTNYCLEFRVCARTLGSDSTALFARAPASSLFFSAGGEHTSKWLIRVEATQRQAHPRL